MKTRRFNTWLKGLTELTVWQCERLARALAAEGASTKVVAAVESRAVSECPHCGTGHPARYGTASGLQRYRCYGCGRTFNALTGTPLARLRYQGQWDAFAQALREGLSVRKAAVRCGVHRNTAHRWRQRFLA